MPEPDETSTTSRQFLKKSAHEGATGKKDPIGYCTAFMHLVKATVGTGIFALGEAFMFSGYVLGPILLTVIGLMNLNCQHMLVNACLKIAAEEEEEVHPSFAETVQYTLEGSRLAWTRKHAKKFATMTNLFICITEMGFCCVYFVFIAEHLLEISSQYGFLENDLRSKHIMLAIILGPVWLSTYLGNLKLLMPLTVTANVVMLIGICMVYYYIFDGPLEPIGKLSVFGSYSTVPLFFGTALFSFESITMIINLRGEMEHPQQFVSVCGVLNTGMAFLCLLFASFGLLSYWKYGDKIESSVFLNLPTTDVLSICTKGLICLGVLFTYTLHMYIAFEVTYPLFHKRFGPFKYDVVMRAVYRALPVLLTFLIANVVPFLGSFISLVGASTGSFVALVMPPILDMIASREKLKWYHYVKNAIICGVGIIGAVTGTLLNLYDIIIKFKEEYSGNRTVTNNTSSH